MKKIVLLTALIMGLGVAGFAQGPGSKGHGHKPKSPEEMAQAQTDRLAEKLSLNDDQKKQVYALNLERSKKFAEEIKARKEEMKGKRQEMIKSQQANEDQLEKILTPAQKESYEKMKAERKEKMHAFKGKRGRLGKRPGKMFGRPALKDSVKTNSQVN